MRNKHLLFALVVLVTLCLTACVAGTNHLKDTSNGDGDVAGFWLGLWQGFIVFFSFIGSLFKDNVNIYEVHNNGGWYNFGFLLGVIIFFGGAGSQSQ